MDGTDVSEQRDLPLAGIPEPAQAAGAMPSLLEQYLSDPSHDYKTLKYGDVMDGVIMRIDRDEILVDIGSKSEGIVPSKEFSSLSGEEKQALAIGETVLVFVVQPENQEGHAVVSIDRARQEKSWRKLQEIFENNEVIEAEVTNYNKGGLLVNLDGVRGFVPASQVSEIRGGDDASKQADMARLIGTTLPLKVIEINRHRNRLILSERQAIQERRDVMKEKLIEELKEGEVRKGRVSSICDFGAFVDIGGADGLVHLSELSWSRVRHPSEVLKVGQEIDVYVLGINAQEKKIALSIKRTQAEPWSRVATKYEVGQLVRGTVTQLANFGAFARIEDGIEGLIHVSELTDERITHPKQVVKEGQELILRIIRIDPQRRRMGLSLRRALDTPDAELVAVLGEGATEERDHIVQTIRAALEAEGIEIGSGRAARESEAEEGGPAQTTDGAPEATATPGVPAPVGEPNAPAPDGIAVTASTVEPATPAIETPASGGRSRGQRPNVEIPSDIDGEPLSAIGMAFAMAGADLDLVTGEADTDETDTAPAEATQASAESEDTPAGEASAPADVADEGASSDGEEREG
jgi:small subunit ribosomal protein S1